MSRPLEPKAAEVHPNVEDPSGDPAESPRVGVGGFSPRRSYLQWQWVSKKAQVAWEAHGSRTRAPRGPLRPGGIMADLTIEYCVV